MFLLKKSCGNLQLFFSIIFLILRGKQNDRWSRH